jgi:hypothetical protein
MAKRPPTLNRPDIINAVKGPLGFFVLALLVTETGFGIVRLTGQDQPWLFTLNLGVIIILAVIVGILAFAGVLTETEKNSQPLPDYSLFIEPPSDLPGLDLNAIDWDEPNCLMRIGDKTIECKPTSPFGAKGPALEIRIASKDMPADHNTAVDLTLTDRFGNRFGVRRFRLWQRNLSLRTRSDKEKDKIRLDYPGESGQ